MCRHLRDLLRDTARSDYLFKEHNQILADFSRQRMTKETVEKLLKLAEKAKLKEKIEDMFTGKHINVTEDRPVLHVALRAPRDQVRTPNHQPCPRGCIHLPHHYPETLGTENQLLCQSLTPRHPIPSYGRTSSISGRIRSTAYFI
jgi:hypothetical protein